MVKTLIVPCLVTLGKSWCFFMSKFSTLHLSSQGLSLEDSELQYLLQEKLLIFPTWGREVRFVFIFPVPHSIISPAFFKTLLLGEASYSVVSALVSLTQGAYSSIMPHILTSAHATPTPARMSLLTPKRVPPPETFTSTSLQPSVPLDTLHCVIIKNCSPTTYKFTCCSLPILIFQPSS